MSRTESTSVQRWRWLLAAALGALSITTLVVWLSRDSMASRHMPAVAGTRQSDPAFQPTVAGDYVILAWNDLGMHCYNADFQYLAVLPPYNSLWAQVVRVGNPPQIVTDTTVISLTYHFADNTYSVGKSNFWDYDQQLFGVDLPPNVGLTGKGLSGTMDPHGDHFSAEGIPLTEFRDSHLSTPYPYQLATVTLWDVSTGGKLAETVVVAPVSTEMHCDNCHSDGQQEEIATGNVGLNILTLHDTERDENLVGNAPVLCAECHSSNALGTVGVPGVPSLSNAMHDQHREEVTADLAGCYQCHPGPQTQCLRDVMAQRGMDCIDCHGGMAQVAQKADPWLDEPTCGNSGCHTTPAYAQDQALYRLSTGHGGIYCAACHDSPHAIAPSRETNDGLKFISWQGHTGTLDFCATCHAYAPEPPGIGPHGDPATWVRDFSLVPDDSSVQPPGATVTYTHVLYNWGNLTDTYTITWTTTQEWATVSLEQDGLATNSPVYVTPGNVITAHVALSIPSSDSVLGLTDTTVITATSSVDPSLVRAVTDTTTIRWSTYLPLVARE